MVEWIYNLGSGFNALLTVCGMLFPAYALGTLCLSIINLKSDKKVIPSNLITLIIGIDLLAFIVLLTGFMKWINPLSASLFLGAGFLVSIPIILKNKSWYLDKKYLYLAFILPFAALILCSAFLYPVGWDELVYHLAVPFRWLGDASPLVYADNPYSAFPGLSELLFWLSMTTGGITAPGMFTYAVWLLIFIALFKLLISKNKSPIIFLLAFCFSPIVIMLIRETYVEPFIILNLLGGILLLKETDPQKAPWPKLAIVIGILAGAVCAVKLTGLICSLVMAIIFFGFLLRSKQDLKYSRMLSAILVLAVTVFIFILPFYLRPWYYTGNPFYPYFANVFSNSEAALTTSQFHHAIGKYKYGLHGTSAFFSTPLLIAFKDNVFDGNFGWQFILILLLFLREAYLQFKRKNKNYACLGLIIAVPILYTFWFFTSQQARFLLPLYLICILVAAKSFLRFSQKIRMVIIAILVLTSAASIPRSIYHFTNGWRHLLKNLRPIDYVYSGTADSYLQAMSILKSQTPEDASVLLIFEERGLYVPRHYEIGTPFKQEKYFTPPESVKSPEQIMAKLKEEKITHLLIGLNMRNPDRIPDYLERVTPFAEKLGSLIEQKRLKKLWEKDGFALYSVQN
jgi:hypothetical protein